MKVTELNRYYYRSVVKRMLDSSSETFIYKTDNIEIYHRIQYLPTAYIINHGFYMITEYYPNISEHNVNPVKFRKFIKENSDDVIITTILMGML